MDKIVVVSDSHGHYPKLVRLIELEYPFNILIHCGDGINDLMHADVPEDVRVIKVLGNVDLHRGVDAERTLVTRIEGKNILVTHGDLFRVQYEYDSLISTGLERGADIILFGHTHIKHLSRHNPVLFNPGTLSKGLYGVIKVGNTLEFFHRILPRGE